MWYSNDNGSWNFTWKIYDSKIDLWSIGIIIYLMCFNDLPFDRNNYLRNVIGNCSMKQKN